MFLGIHPVDLLVLLVYFAAILYLGVYLGASKTKNLGDFLVAGGKWGPLVSFIFVFASAIAGNEAIVVSGKAYHSGMSGVWLWWSFLFATPVYFLFSTYYRRARVYNLAEFLEMRFQKDVAAIYAQGACAALTPPGASRALPPTAQVAHQQAKYLIDALPRALQGRPVRDFRYRDLGALVSLADYDAFGSLGQFGLFHGQTFRGRLAQISHVMLYRSHQARIHGFWRGGLLWLVDRLNSRVRAPIRLD